MHRRRTGESGHMRDAESRAGLDVRLSTGLRTGTLPMVRGEPHRSGAGGPDAMKLPLEAERVLGHMARE